MSKSIRRWLAVLFLASLVSMAWVTDPAAAQAQMPTPFSPASPTAIPVETAYQALAQDAATVAPLIGVDLAEAEARLRAQEAIVPAINDLNRRFAERLAGVWIEQRLDFHIAVLLTGTAPVADEVIDTGERQIPVRFMTGAVATRNQLLAAISYHQAELRAALSRPPGMGVDPRSGTLLIFVSPADVDREGLGPLSDRLARIAGVPVSVRTVDSPATNMAVEGGGRVTGLDPANGHRYACTTGFAVTDGQRMGVLTAAHCPDSLDFSDPVRGRVPLTMVGQWGWGFQDVQVHVTDEVVSPLFFADSAKAVLRPVESVRSRAATVSGDWVCHRGERTGYSCAEVELTDFAPAGDLCGGACTPTWVTVRGPGCRGGDSGAPVFAGTVALGIVKGGTYRADGSCAFYFYMSVDYLPTGWSLMTSPPPTPMSTPKGGTNDPEAASIQGSSKK